MADETEPLLFEDEISAALRAEPRKWTPKCLEPDALIELIERGGRSRRAKRMLAHLGNCSYCRHEYGAMRQMLQRADTMRQALADTAPPPQPATLRRRRLVQTFAFAGTLATLAIIVGLVRAVVSLRSQNAARQARLTTTNREHKFAVTDADGERSEWQRATIDAIRKKKLPILDDLMASSNRADAPEHMMGAQENEQFSLLSPVGTVVESDRPTFRWQPVSQARNYTVHVVDDNTGKEVIKSKPVAAGNGKVPMQWTPPSSETLQRARNGHGGIYRWYVTYEQDDDTEVYPDSAAPIAKFKVMELARLNVLTAKIHRFAGSHWLRGLHYAWEGLLDEAEAEFKAVPKSDLNSANAKQLLGKVRELHNAEKAP